MKVLFLTKYGRNGASSRMRTWQFLPLLESQGIACTVCPLFGDDLLAYRYRRGKYALWDLMGAYANRFKALFYRKNFDLIWIEKEALPWFPASLERLLLGKTPYILDYDDAIFHNYDLHRSRLVRKFLGGRIDHLMAGADAVTCGNLYLADRATNAGARNVIVVPTVVDPKRYAPRLKMLESEIRPKIVWIGSPSTTKYLAGLLPILQKLSLRRKFVLRLIGAGEIAMPGISVERVTWSEETECQAIADCQIGVMPLLDSPWERGKCGYKLIQYMAAGLPVVASAVGANLQIVESNTNGFLAHNNEEWIAALECLIDNAQLRQRLGQNGCAHVGSRYSNEVAGNAIINLLRQVADTSDNR